MRESAREGAVPRRVTTDGRTMPARRRDEVRLLQAQNRIRNKQRAQLTVPLIGIDDHDRFASRKFALHIVAVGQAEGELGRRDRLGHLPVIGQDAGVAFHRLEKFFRLRGADGLEQARGMRRRGTVERLGDTDPVVPLRIDQVFERLQALADRQLDSY